MALPPAAPATAQLDLACSRPFQQPLPPTAASAPTSRIEEEVLGELDYSLPMRSPGVATKRSRNKIAARESRQIATRRCWRAVAVGKCGLEHVSSDDDSNRSFNPVLQDGAPLDVESCAEHRLSFNFEEIGHSCQPTCESRPTTLEFTRLEHWLEERLDALDEKLDGVARLLSPEEACHACVRQEAVQHSRRRLRNMSGWGVSKRFGTGPCIDAAMFAGGGDLTGSGSDGPNTGSRQCSCASSRHGTKDSVRIELGALHSRQAEERKHSTSSKGSQTEGWCRQHSPASASVSDRDQCSTGARPISARGRPVLMRSMLRRSMSLPSLVSHESAASVASQLSARGVDRRSSLAEHFWVFFEDPGSSRTARLYHQFYVMFAFLSAVVPVMETLPDPRLPSAAFCALSTAIDAIFLAEMTLRWAVSPSNLGFVLRFYNILDIAIVGPLILRILACYVWGDEGAAKDADASWFAQSFLLCIVPVMRLIKALRGQRNFALLTYTINNVLEPLCVPLLMIMIVSLVFSCTLYVVEPRDNVASVPHAMWLVVLTVSTVGYGDVVPVTDLGRIMTSMLVFVGCLCMAMPIGIVGTAFTETWRNRSKILTMRRIRDRLNQWGFTDEDLKVLFKAFDRDENGQLDAMEFRDLIRSMRLGLDEGHIKSLFAVLDVDGNGGLDKEEFVDAVGLKKSDFPFRVF